MFIGVTLRRRLTQIPQPRYLERVVEKFNILATGTNSLSVAQLKGRQSGDVAQHEYCALDLHP